MTSGKKFSCIFFVVANIVVNIQANEPNSENLLLQNNLRPSLTGGIGPSSMPTLSLTGKDWTISKQIWIVEDTKSLKLHTWKHFSIQGCYALQLELNFAKSLFREPSNLKAAMIRAEALFYTCRYRIEGFESLILNHGICELLTNSLFFRIWGKNGGWGGQSSGNLQLLQEDWQVCDPHPVNQGRRGDC